MAKLIHAFSHKTGTQNVGFLCHLSAIFPFLSSACIRCMNLHSFFIPAFASQRQHWRGSGLMMHLH
ncbi:Uncharacterised protein [Enterobacter hormaechei]|nr:hypothetical protein L353_08170 [Enterobacter sp. MGH 7]KJF30950.1 hypothetical protein L469_03019 [Enterobacter hormaechei]CZV54020.1 Uncharacterised protein [Enterobacter hormaechei]